MTTLTVHDPAMCCATGICGAEIDQRLVTLAADLDWLNGQGVRVQRFGQNREPAECAASDTVRQILHDSDGDDLPVFLVDGAQRPKARSPVRAEMAGRTGVADTPAVPKAGFRCGPAQANAVKPTGCCCASPKTTAAQGKAACCC